MGKNVSLKDIAKEVGVSVATVSYVLSKGNDSGVSEAVTKKVLKAAKLLNYQPNQVARSLKMGKTFSIGLIVADISNPFFSEIARNIEDEAKKNDYTVIFGSSDERAEKSWDLIQFLSNRQVDGFIIAPSESSESQIQYLKNRKIPFVLIDRFFPEIETNYVVTDNFQAAYNATSRLIETGNKKIGMFAYTISLYHMRERIRGYKYAMERHGLEPNVAEIHYDNIKEEVNIALENMIEEFKLDALFFATNSLAIPGLKYIDTAGLKVGDDLAVISFDQGEAFDFYYCPLTFVKQPLLNIAKQATDILIEEINSGKFLKQQVCLSTDLIIRSSCSKK